MCSECVTRCWCGFQHLWLLNTLSPPLVNITPDLLELCAATRREALPDKIPLFIKAPGLGEQTEQSVNF